MTESQIENARMDVCKNCKQYRKSVEVCGKILLPINKAIEYSGDYYNHSGKFCYDIYKYINSLSDEK